MGSTRTNWLIALISFCLTGLLAFAAGEAFVRMTLPYETPDTIRESSLQYEATLFSRFSLAQTEQTVVQRGGEGLYRINKLGYRGRDFTIPKPEGTIRILFLGGSAAFDLNAPDGRDWPHLVEEGLRARGWQQVEVVNAATPGYATWDSLGRLYSEAWMFEPDYVVLYNAWNDIKYFSWLSPEKSLQRGYRPATSAGYGRDLNVAGNPFMYYNGPLERLLGLSQLYTRLRWAFIAWQSGPVGLEGSIKLDGSREPVSRPPYQDWYGEWGPRQYELDLRLIADAARGIGATPIFLTQARLVSPSNTESDRKRIGYHWANLSHEALVRAFSDTDEALFKVAKEKAVPLLDLAKLLAGRSELFVDHVHTTPEGSEALARATADFLAEVLSRTAGG